MFHLNFSQSRISYSIKSLRLEKNNFSVFKTKKYYLVIIFSNAK